MRKKFLRILLKILAALFSVALILLVGFLLVLAQPSSDDTETAEPQPPLAASPAVDISQETEIRSLIESFPVPVLSFMSGSGMVFVSGSSADINIGVRDGFGRMVTLNWQTADGEPVRLQSIYPASALSALEKGYRFSAVAGPSLFGADTVRMESGDVVRVHTATGSGLYVVSVPRPLSPKLSALCRSLLLFTVKKEE